MRFVHLIILSIVVLLASYVAISRKIRGFEVISEFLVFIWQKGIFFRFIQAFSGLTLVLLVIFIPVGKIAITESKRVCSSFLLCGTIADSLESNVQSKKYICEGPAPPARKFLENWLVFVEMDATASDSSNHSNGTLNVNRDGFRRNGNLHLFLPSPPTITTTLVPGGSSISGARSVPVSSASSPSEENGRDYLSISKGGRHLAPVTPEVIQKPKNAHSYRTGKSTMSTVIYDYDKIFNYRTRVKSSLKAAAAFPLVTRVFWPTDCIPVSLAASVLVGFRNSKSDFVIIAIFPDVDIATMTDILSRKETLEGTVYESASLQGAYDPSKLSVIGTLNADFDHGLSLRVEQDSLSSPPRFTSQEYKPTHKTSIQINGKTNHIVENGDIGSKPMSFQIIYYQRPLPRRLQYFSFLPITLDVDNRDVTTDIDDDETKEQKARNALVAQLKKHQVFGFQLTDKDNRIDIWINEINISHELGTLLQRAVSRAIVDNPDSSMFAGAVRAIFRPVGKRLSGFLLLLEATLLGVFKQILIGALKVFEIVAEAILLVIEWKPKQNIPALIDISATIQQIDLRLQQACHWPVQYMKLRDQKRDLFTKTTFHPEYIRFYNSLWLVANDIIIGAALGAYILDNSDYIVSFVDFCINELLTTGLRKTIGWLMNWPGGLKLNNELGAFFGELFLWVIEFWGGYLRIFRPFLGNIVYVIGMSSFVGATFSIAMIADLTSFLTTQIYSCYLVSARIYNWQLTVLVSLFHLFRGKRRNVLRNRIDSVDYDLDQLLIGTLLFTLLTFLLPTVLVFYLAFASARFGIIVLNAMLESSLVLLNHFPLFALMLRLKDSKRLPGGIEFDIVFDEMAESDTVYIRLKPLPLPVTTMFHQYFLLSRRIQRHYLSFRVISLLLTGQFVPRATHR